MEITALLREDVPYMDLTSSILDFGPAGAEIQFLPKEPLTVCCSEEAAAVLTLLGAETTIHAASGSRADTEKPVLSARGNPEQLHMGWKAAQNLLEHFSGIATRTRSMVEQAHGVKKNIAVCGTRKHLPGTKQLSLKALCAGGGFPHRLGLSDSILIFSNHYDLLGGLNALCGMLPQVRKRCPEKKVAVEVESVNDAVMVAEAGADIIQLDKLPPSSVREVSNALRSSNRKTIIAAAGGIDAENAASYADAGADVLVSSWMYFGKPSDFKVTIRTAGTT